MSKKILFPLASSFVILSVLPSTVVACSTTDNSEAQNLKLLEKELANYGVNINKVTLNEQYQSVKDDKNNYQINLLANDVNMFKLTLNDQYSVTEESEQNKQSLSSIFKIKPHDFDFITVIEGDKEEKHPQKQIDFSFNYDLIDSSEKAANPYLNDAKNAIIIPVLASLVDLKTGTVLATKYLDFFALQILKTDEVDNNEDLGFNGLAGKRVYFENDQSRTWFQSIPDEIIDKYLEFQAIKEEKFQSPVVYDTSEINKWKNKTFAEVKSISGAIKNPVDAYFSSANGSDSKRYSYSIIDSAFDQYEWEFPRFNIRFQPADFGGIIQNHAKLYGLVFSKKYSYVDRRFKFRKPSESDISSEKSKNDTLAGEIVKKTENSNIFNPIVNFSRDDVKEFGVDKIVEFFNKSKTQFLAPPEFIYTVLDDDKREVWFELAEARKDEGEDSVVIAVDVKLNVGRKQLQGSSTFTKKFDTSSWRWV